MLTEYYSNQGTNYEHKNKTNKMKCLKCINTRKKEDGWEYVIHIIQIYMKNNFKNEKKLSLEYYYNLRIKETCSKARLEASY